MGVVAGELATRCDRPVILWRVFTERPVDDRKANMLPAPPAEMLAMGDVQAWLHRQTVEQFEPVRWGDVSRTTAELVP
jgi:hypothetical protein